MMRLKTRFLRDVVMPVGDVLFGQRMIRRLKFLEEAQFWSSKQIIDCQNRQLSGLMQTAFAEVPFYRDLMNRANIHPDEIRSASDLARLPVITKDLLRRAYPSAVTRETGQKTYESKTSGSTGKNFVVLEDAETAGWYRATFMLALEWSGWQIGDPHLQTGMTLKRSLDRRLKDALLACHYVSAYQLDDQNLDRILGIIADRKLKFVWGYPGSIYYLAKRARELGWNQALRAVSTWGDSLTPAYRKTIEQAFGCKVYDTYGCGEGFQVAAQCEFGHYHVHALDVILEFLNDQHQPVAEGEVGNLVVTRLHPGPMPLVRYQVGDLGVSAASSPCECGRELPLMGSVIGRKTDVIETPSGNRLIVHFFTGIFEHFNEIDSFQVEQDRSAHITVRAVTATPVHSDLPERIIQALSEKGAQDLSIDVEFVDSIALSPAGKHHFIIRTMQE